MKIPLINSSNHTQNTKKNSCRTSKSSSTRYHIGDITRNSFLPSAQPSRLTTCWCSLLFSPRPSKSLSHLCCVVFFFRELEKRKATMGKTEKTGTDLAHIIYKKVEVNFDPLQCVMENWKLLKYFSSSLACVIESISSNWYFSDLLWSCEHTPQRTQNNSIKMAQIEPQRRRSESEESVESVIELLLVLLLCYELSSFSFLSALSTFCRLWAERVGLSMARQSGEWRIKSKRNEMSGKWFFSSLLLPSFLFPTWQRAWIRHSPAPASSSSFRHTFLISPTFCVDFFAAATQFGVFRVATIEALERRKRLATHNKLPSSSAAFDRAFLHGPQRNKFSVQPKKSRILYFVYLSDLSPYSSHSCVPFVLRNLKLQQTEKKRRRKKLRINSTHIFTRQEPIWDVLE